MLPARGWVDGTRILMEWLCRRREHGAWRCRVPTLQMSGARYTLCVMLGSDAWYCNGCRHDEGGRAGRQFDCEPGFAAELTCQPERSPCLGRSAEYHTRTAGSKNAPG